jgi:putative glycerol-1-phosphate prenyltransferase
LIVDIKSWKHVFKLDPEKTLSDEQLERICTSGTHGIIVGGSTGVTFNNTVDLLFRIRQYELPCVLEVSHPDAIVPGFDMYLIPVVLNANDPQWIVGQHAEALKEYGRIIDWEEVLTEGYVILNADSAAARLTGAKTTLDVEDVEAYARMAEHLFHMPIFYIEYSGTFGDMELVRHVRRTLKNTQLFYGGGIDSLEKAQAAAAVADTIVVGNIVYDNLDAALQTLEVLGLERKQYV